MAENQADCSPWIAIRHRIYSGREVQNRVRFTEEKIMCTEKHVLVEKYLQID